MERREPMEDTGRETGTATNAGRTVFSPEDMARLIDRYLEDILSVLTKPNGYLYLYGGAASIRKLVEAMSGYLLESRLGQGKAAASSKKDSLRALLGSCRELYLFTAAYDRVLPDPNASGSDGPQRLLHYQSAREPDGTYRDHEKSRLISDYSDYHLFVCECLEAVIAFLSYAPEVERCAAEDKSLERLRDYVLSYRENPEKVGRELSGKGKTLYETAAGKIEELYGDPSDSIDPWLNWHCLILQKLTDQKSQLSRSNCAVVCRKITERCMARKAWEVGLGSRIPANATIENLLQLYKKEEKIFRETEKTKSRYTGIDLSGYARMISVRANALVHFGHPYRWDADRPECPDDKIREAVNSEYNVLLSKTSELVSEHIVEKRPVYAWDWTTLIREKGIGGSYRAANKRLRYWVFGLSLLLVVAAACAVLVLRPHNNTVKRYYADYIWRNGAPEGLGELTAEQAGKQSHYLFEEQEGTVRSVRLADAAGNTMNEVVSVRKCRPARIEIEYTGEAPSRVSFFDADSGFLLAAAYDRNYRTGEISAIRLADQEGYDFSLPADVTSMDLASWLDTGDDGQKASYSGISGVEVTETENGLIREVRFGLRYDEKDANGITGISFSHDADGRVKEISYLYDTLQEDRNAPVKTTYSYSGGKADRVENILSDNTVIVTRYDYSPDGDVIRESRMTAAGMPDSDSKDIAEVRYHFNPEGRIRRIVHLGSDGQLIAGADGWASVSYSWDKQGRETETAYFDAYDNAVVVGSWARLTTDYEKNKRTVNWYGKDGKPGLKNADYVSRSETVTETDGGTVYLYERFDSKGVRVLYKGAYQWRYTVDAQGDIVLIEALDDSGQPMFSGSTSYARMEITYNRHKPVERAYLDEKGGLTDGSRGYARRKTTYTKSLGLKETVTDYNSAGEIVRRQDYRYEENTGRLKKVSFLDSGGNPVFDSDAGYAWKEYDYEDRGSEVLERISYYGADGGPVMYTSSAGNSYAVIETGYDANGFFVSEALYDDQKQPVPYAGGGYYRIEVERDGRGNACAWGYYDPDGNLMLSSDGYARIERKYGPNNNTILEKMYGPDGGLIQPEKYGYAVYEAEYDQAGNLLSKSYRDRNEEPYAPPSYGYARADYTYDGSGNQLTARYLDEKGQPAVVPDLGYSGLDCEYDDEGRTVSWTYHGADGGPAVHPEQGYATCRYTYENGRTTSISYFDESGNPMTVESLGYARKEWTYPGEGEEDQYLCCGPDGNPVMIPSLGAAGARQVFNDRGFVIRITWLGTDGEPFFNEKEGCVSAETEIGENNLRISESWFGAGGEPMINPVIGCASRRWEYDRDGNETFVCFYDTAHELMINVLEGGFASREIVFSDGGKKKTVSHFDTRHQLMMNNDGYARYEEIVNDRGETVSWTYYGADGSPILYQSGYARIERDLDDQGRVTETRLYNEELRLLDSAPYPAVCRYEYGPDGKQSAASEFTADGVMRCRILYRDGRETERTYYDGNGRPAVDESAGFARKSVEYDAAGNIVLTCFYDGKGSLMVHPSLGYAKMTEEYDDAGRSLCYRYYGPDDMPMVNPAEGYAACRQVYDAEGRLLERTFRDAQDRPVVSPRLGYARLVHEYDAEGRGLGWTYYGAGGKIADNPVSGYARKAVTLNGSGCETETAYYNAEGNLVYQEGLGYAMLRQDYDEDGRLLRYRMYGADGQLIYHGGLGYCGYDQEYDEEGHLCRRTFIGDDGRPAPLYGENPVTIQYTCDSAGRVLTEAYLDGKGQPAACPSQGSVYGKRFSYHTDGRIASETYLDFDGSVLRTDPEEYGYDYSGRRYQYDSQGRETAVTLCDADGNPFVSGSRGYCTVRYSYDNAGRLSRTDYLGVSWEPMVNPFTHFASVVYLYNGRGEKETAEYYDAEGKLIMSRKEQ